MQDAPHDHSLCRTLVSAPAATAAVNDISRSDPWIWMRRRGMTATVTRTGPGRARLPGHRSSRFRRRQHACCFALSSCPACDHPIHPSHPHISTSCPRLCISCSQRCLLTHFCSLPQSASYVLLSLYATRCREEPTELFIWVRRCGMEGGAAHPMSWRWS
jgi:hypothetical protein